ncbi:hypothetical protein [Microtetraspora niveoalba]|uniref:hypothetical protein n=1 Tax=Microtetraspora niveoalba TaxID=46175 RepID=UPI0008304915|nr:hypothetical protein [Microtetraspora niveoalba]
MSHLPSEVADDFASAAVYWLDFLEARFPGTPRPSHPRVLTREDRARRDELARVERAERVLVMPGEHPAPLHLDVSQAADELAEWAYWCAVRVAEAIMRPVPAPPQGLEDVQQVLDFAARLIVEADFVCAGLAEELASTARWIAESIYHHLHLRPDGQVITVICPWCKGITEDEPLGGAYTWRVRVLPGDQVAIVCESGSCEPPLREVGTWWGGRPCWPLPDWGRLARFIAAR